MTPQDYFLEYIRDFHTSNISTAEKKNRDYAGVEEPLRNFYDSANIAGVTVEQGILVRMADKVARTRNLTERGSLGGDVGEKLEDTLKDLANYSAILAYFVTNNYNSEEVNNLSLESDDDSDESTQLNLFPAFEEDKVSEDQPKPVNDNPKSGNWFTNFLLGS